MSKANQKFVANDEAVSPVIGVILMVAITVILAAVVFVVVGNLAQTEDAAENVAIRTDSPRANVLTVQLIREGANAPYNLTDATNANFARVLIDGNQCVHGGTGNFTDSAGTGLWEVGNPLTFDNDDCGTGGLVSGSEHTVSVIIRGTLVYEDNIVIR